MAAMILVTHAYSRVNLGDALLVDETLSLLRRALPAGMPMAVAALDAASFEGHLDGAHSVQIPGTSGPGRLGKLAPVMLQIIPALAGTAFSYAPFDELKKDIQMVVGVGGAYLRCGWPLSTAKMFAAHFTQLLWTVRSGLPSLYMPQSIGPLYGITGAWVQQLVKRVGSVALRDDLSVSELMSGEPENKNRNLHRIPDLAVLKLARQGNIQKPAQNGKIFISAREIHNSFYRPAYLARLKELKQLLPEAEIITQSSGRNNNDEKLYAELGWPTHCRTIADVSAAGEGGVMIAVRLHGALQSILAGIPAVHLSYERKGYGAYQDMNLMPWLHPAADFNPAAVAHQARETLKSPVDYWQRLEGQRADLLQKEINLTELIKNTYKS